MRNEELIVLAVFSIMMLIFGALCIVMVVAWWKIFTKAGKPGWASLIPFYNTIVLLEIAGKPWWWLLLMFIPFVGIYFLIVMWIEICKSFGKGTGFMVGIFLLHPIFLCILAFGSARYLGSGGTGQQPAFQPQTPMPPQA